MWLTQQCIHLLSNINNNLPTKWTRIELNDRYFMIEYKCSVILSGVSPYVMLRRNIYKYILIIT